MILDQIVAGQNEHAFLDSQGALLDLTVARKRHRGD